MLGRTNRGDREMSEEKPEYERGNFISVYWEMLMVLESRVDPDKDVLDKMLVEGAYKVLRRAKIFDADLKPRWERK
jgi:hypothetical protein